MSKKESKVKKGLRLRCEQMPELHHSYPGEPFDIMASEVSSWLVDQPEARQIIFDIAKDNNMIEYDPENGIWKGVNVNGD